MIYDLQKASFLKRLSAFILDAILLLILVTGLMLVMSSVLNIDGHYETLEAAYQKYEQKYQTSFQLTQEEYDALSEADRATLDAAYAEFSNAEEALYAYNMLINLLVLMIPISIFLAYLLLEFIPGHDLMRAEREDLRLVLDALIQLQRRFCHSEDPLRSFEASLEGRKNRRNYLRENCLERVYDAYLQAYLRMFRTLCHDDLLPFNVLVCDQRAVMIDWEHAGILPYPTSVARLIAHGEEDENAFFYLKSSDKQFVIDYYYDNFVKEMGISRDEYDWHMNLCLFYEYCEWVYVGNRYGNTNSQRFLHYTQKAMQMAEVLSEKI